MKLHQLALGLALCVAVAGCGGMTQPKPDSPEVQFGLAAVNLAAMAGGDQIGQREPKLVPNILRGIDAAEQLMKENADYTKVLEAIQLGVKDARGAAYITKAVGMVHQYVQSKTGVLTDANTVGYQAIAAVIDGLKAGLAIHTQTAVDEHTPAEAAFDGAGDVKG